jgi:hypothetical protein
MHHKYHRSALHKTGHTDIVSTQSHETAETPVKKQRTVHALQLAGLSSLVHDGVAAASLESLL